MTPALILALTIITSTRPHAAIDRQTITPVVMSLEQAAEPSSVHATFVSPLEQICTNWCNDQKVLCCADPNESCNYTCEMERIRCNFGCRTGGGGAY